MVNEKSAILELIPDNDVFNEIAELNARQLLAQCKAVDIFVDPPMIFYSQFCLLVAPELA